MYLGSGFVFKEGSLNRNEEAINSIVIFHQLFSFLSVQTFIPLQRNIYYSNADLV